MDAQCGGLPSPVLCLPDGTHRFFPLPIPYVHSDLHYSSLCLLDGFTAWDFIKDVAPNYKQHQTCHLDPDLIKAYLPGRHQKWQPAFGQVAQAQTHLENNGIGPGDLFLFFGWFQFAEIRNGKFSYRRTADYPAGFHAIYGWLQVDEIYKPNGDAIPDWLHCHPHVQQQKHGVFKKLNNTIYTASKFFYSAEAPFSKPGAGWFRFSENLILTKKGQPARTVWKLPETLHPDNGISLSYHSAKSWLREPGATILRSASQSQEFIVTEDRNGAAAAWALDAVQSRAAID